MLSQKKSSIEKLLMPFVHYFKHSNPNILTLLGSIPPLLFFVFVVLHLYIFALISFPATMLDLLDGMVARKYNKVTPFGGFLDSLMDRVADFLIIIAFAFGGIVRWDLTALLLMLSFLISYARSRGELASNNTVRFNIGVIERTERLILIFAALLLYTLFPAISFSGFNIAEIVFLILILLSFYTLLQRIMYAYRRL